MNSDEMVATNGTLHSVMWQQIREIGLEHFSLRKLEQEWHLKGTILTLFSGQPTTINYAIRCDETWKTDHVHVTMNLGQSHQPFLLTRDEQSNWQINGVDDHRLSPCVDVDLGITPATNMLPIRRLKLAVGQSATVPAAWVRFPQLSVELLEQRYTRLDEKRYRYESRGGAFETEFEVDVQGLVMTYPNLWERVGI
ncbi:MAG: putative glycolipid-binding domain-containing protein [Chloroflexota bacterium]